MKNLVIILSTALLFSLLGNWYQYRFPRIIPNKPDLVFRTTPNAPPTTVYNLPQGNQSATANAVQQYKEKSEKAQELIDLVVAENPGIEKAKEVETITKVKANLELKLTEKDLIISEKDQLIAKKDEQIKYWESKDKFNKVTVNNATNDVTVNSEIAPIIATSAKRPKWYKPKENFITITSPNPFVKFYGIESYRFKNPDRKDLVNLSAEIGGRYFLKPNNPLQVFAGIRGTFNPDGKFQPSILGGYVYDPITGKMEPMAEARLNYTIFE